MKRLTVFAVPMAAAAASLVCAGAALAGTSQISGSFPNGGCSDTSATTVSGPSRIDVQVSTTSASNMVYTEILKPDGSRASTSGSYDTTSGGTYGVRVCSYSNKIDPQTMQYSGIVGTGPAGQSALRTQAEYSSTWGTGGVLGARTTLSRTATGHGAILTGSGLAWVTVNATSNGRVIVRIDNSARHIHMRLTSGLSARFGANTVRITGRGISVVVVDKGSQQRMALATSKLKASGKVVRGTFQISV